MAHGLRIDNPSGALVVDADSQALHYIGQATFSTNTTVTNNSAVLNRTKRRYTITLASTADIPMVAIRPTTDRWMSLEDVRRSSSGSATWYIDLYSADSGQLAFNSTNFTSSASAEVHVWSTGVPSGSPYGLRLFNSAGALTCDFGAKPLFIKQVMAFPTQTDRTTYRFGDSQAFIGGLTTPLICFPKLHGKDNIRVGSIGTHEDSSYAYQTDGAGNLKRVLLSYYKEFGETGGSAYTPVPDWSLPSQTLFIMDAADYA